MKLYYDDEGIVRLASTSPIITNVFKCVDVEDPGKDPIGKKIVFNRPERGLRLAVLCNWGDHCGIATYSKYLVDSLLPIVDSLKLFAEDVEGARDGDGYEVTRCWKRGSSMAAAMREVIAWKPTVVLIQHEFGIFPRAPYFLQMVQMLDANRIPYVVTLHSVYEHLDKVICSGAMRNIVVHSHTGADCLKRLGHTANVRVIPHGCVSFGEVEANWNMTGTPHSIFQFGFGFSYKGVDTALRAVAALRSKYPDIHYLYMCSESPHVKRVNDSYYRSIVQLIEDLDLVDHAVVIRGFQTEDVLNQYLRTYKLAIFPYVTDPKNVVYGASGAIRVAMANGLPVIASASRMFDDLAGVLPRPFGEDQLARAIDRVFSDKEHRGDLIKRASDYIKRNGWPETAARYVDFLREQTEVNPEGVIIV